MLAWWHSVGGVGSARGTTLVARVCFLHGRGLAGKDGDGRSDPYVRARVDDGAAVSAREQRCMGTLNPDFYVRLADIPITIPGISTFEVSRPNSIGTLWCFGLLVVEAIVFSFAFRCYSFYGHRQPHVHFRPALCDPCTRPPRRARAGAGV